MTMSETWHITLPLLLHSRHIEAGSLFRVCRRWDAIMHDAYPDLGPFHKLAYVRTISERLMTTRVVCLLDHLITLPTADEIAAILVAEASECYWGLIGSLREDGRLWMHLDRTWDMSASKYHAHALAMANVLNRPVWLDQLRLRKSSGRLTDVQFTNMRSAIYSRVLRTLDGITTFHNASRANTTEHGSKLVESMHE